MVVLLYVGLLVLAFGSGVIATTLILTPEGERVPDGRQTRRPRRSGRGGRSVAEAPTASWAVIAAEEIARRCEF